MTRTMLVFLIRSLRSTICPACPSKKRANESLCGACYRELPQSKRRALYKRLFEGYEAAIVDAFDSLGVKNARLVNGSGAECLVDTDLLKSTEQTQ